MEGHFAKKTFHPQTTCRLTAALNSSQPTITLLRKEFSEPLIQTVHPNRLRNFQIKQT